MTVLHILREVKTTSNNGGGGTQSETGFFESAGMIKKQKRPEHTFQGTLGPCDFFWRQKGLLKNSRHISQLQA